MNGDSMLKYSMEQFQRVLKAAYAAGFDDKVGGTTAKVGNMRMLTLAEVESALVKEENPPDVTSAKTEEKVEAPQEMRGAEALPNVGAAGHSKAGTFPSLVDLSEALEKEGEVSLQMPPYGNQQTVEEPQALPDTSAATQAIAVFNRLDMPGQSLMSPLRQAMEDWRNCRFKWFQLGWITSFVSMELHKTFENLYTTAPVTTQRIFELMYENEELAHENPFTSGAFMIHTSPHDWRHIRPKLSALLERYGDKVHSVFLSIGNVAFYQVAEILALVPRLERLYLKVNFIEAIDPDSLPQLPSLRVLRLETMNTSSSSAFLYAYGAQIQYLSLFGVDFSTKFFFQEVTQNWFRNVSFLKISAATPNLMQRLAEENKLTNLQGLSLKFVASDAAMLTATPFILQLMNLSKDTLRDLHLEFSHGSQPLNNMVDWNNLNSVIGAEYLQELVSIECPQVRHLCTNSALIAKEWLRHFLSKCPNLMQLRFFNFVLERRRRRDLLKEEDLPNILEKHYWSTNRRLQYLEVMAQNLMENRVTIYKKAKLPVEEGHLPQEPPRSLGVSFKKKTGSKARAARARLVKNAAPKTPATPGPSGAASGRASLPKENNKSEQETKKKK